MRHCAKVTNAMKAGEDLDRFNISWDEEDILTWAVKFPSITFISDAPELFKDLETFAAKSNGSYLSEVTMEITFPKNFPDSPPFVRVISPRFKYRTGHITVGGSICNILLTSSGWRPLCPVQLILILHNNMIDGKARVDLESPLLFHKYAFAEAKTAFQRVAEDHGWTGFNKRKCDRDEDHGWTGFNKRKAAEKAEKTAAKKAEKAAAEKEEEKLAVGNVAAEKAATEMAAPEKVAEQLDVWG
jgi:ubiquitin-protein ligase